MARKKYYGKKKMRDNHSMMPLGKGQGDYANLPQEVIMKNYPEMRYGAHSDYHGNAYYMEMQASGDHKKVAKSKPKSRY